MYILTFALIILSYLTMFLLVPVYLLGPIAMYCGYRVYRKEMAQCARPTPGRRVWALRAFLVAAASFVFQLYIIHTQYKV